MLKHLLFAAVLAALPFSLSAQCIVADSVAPVCQGAAATLKARVDTSCTNGSNSYTFDVQPSYNPEPFSGGTAIDTSFHTCTSQAYGSHDDCTAGPFNIGFQFCFFNQLYTQFWVGSNGWISFSQPPGTQWCTYTSQAIPNTANSVPKNVIFAPWEDWLPTYPVGTYNVFYYTEGSAPNRKLVVYWLNCRLYACYNNPGIEGTFQIVLDETGGVIENHIQNKPACSNYNATQGVQNIDGTIAYTATGRNNTQWTAANESTTFTPSGITWYKDAYPGGTIVGYGVQITVYPTTTTNYYPVIQTCNGPNQWSNVNVRVLPVPTLSGPDTACLNSTLKYTTEPNMVNYVWTVAGGVIASGGTSTSDSIMVNWNTLAGAHTVGIKYTDPVSGCVALNRVIETVTVLALPVPTIVSGVTPVCPGDTGNLYTTQAGMLNYQWTASAGGVITSGGGTNDNFVKITWNISGTSQVSVIYTNPATHCTAGSPGTFNVIVKPLPDVIFTPQHPSLKWCSQDTVKVTLSSSISGAAFSWNASADPAKIIPSSITGRNGNIIQPYQNIGFSMENVNFQVRATANGCTSNPYPYTVQIDPVPDVIVIPPFQYICSGGTTVPVALSSSVTGTMFSWSYPCGSGFITPCPGSGNGSPITTVTLSNSANSQSSVIYTITSSIDNCPGLTNTHTVTVNPKPALTNSPMNQNACLGTPTIQVNFTANVDPALYQWTATPSSPSITGYPAGIQNTSYLPVQTLVDPSNNAGFVTYAITPRIIMNQLTCYGDIANYIINTKPSPDVTITGPSPSLACEGQSSGFSVPADPSSSFTWSLTPSSVGTLTSSQGLSNATFFWNGNGNSVQTHVTGLTGFGCTASGSSSFFVVRPKPLVSFIQCIDPVTTPDAKPYVLKGGNPAGTNGVYTGTGVSLVSGQYLFDPSAVPPPLPKTITLTYTYLNMYGCPGSDVSTIQVISSPSFQCGNIMQPLQDVRTTPHRQYTTYQRGGRCWMTENLDYGTSGSYQQPQTDNCIPEKYCSDSDPDCSLLGGFYQWDELMQYSPAEGSQGLCPPGWHVPTRAEWQSLIDDPANQGNGLAGGFLKDVPFIAKTGGLLYMNSIWAFGLGDYPGATMFWTSTSNGTNHAYSRGMNSPNTSVSFYSASLANAFTVRCVKDF